VTARDSIVRALEGETSDVPLTIYGSLLPRGRVEREVRALGYALVGHQLVYATYRPNVSSIERQTLVDGEIVTETTLITPVGTISEKRRTEPGYGSSWAIEHFVKGPDDYRVLEYVLRDTVVLPSDTAFVRATNEMGDDGLINTRVSRVPFQRLWIEYAGLDRLLLDLADEPDAVQSVLEAMLETDRQLWRVVAASPARYVWCPDNVTAFAISPAIFAKHFVPYYAELCDVMHAAGKKVYVHMDGALRPIADQIVALPIDIVEAFTPTPTGDLSLGEARALWHGKTVWINYPSSVHVESTRTIEETTEEMLASGPGKGLLIGVTENVPEEHLERSLKAIARVVRGVRSTG
jgi:hypothetical protein